MKAKRILLILFCTLLIPFSLHALGTKEEKNNKLTIYGLKGSPGVGIIRLFEEPPQLQGFDVSLEALAQADLMAAGFISGEIKVGLLPPNIAAKIAASGRDIRVAAIVGTGMFSLLTSDPDVRGIRDLRGKTVESAGQGATPDYVFQRILRAHGLTPGRDVTMGFSLAPPEIAQSLVAGRISTALLPEPFATMALLGRRDLRSVADIQGEWVRAGGSGNYPMTVLVLDGAFASANPGAVEEIINAVKNSIQWVREHPAEAGALAEKHELGFRAAVVAAAVPKSAYVFIHAEEGRPALESLFRVFLEYAPASIGGALPADRFYWK